MADAVGSQIITIKGQELGALGVAINNAVVQGFYGSYQEAVDAIVEVDKVFEPNMENHEQYLKFYELYKLIRDQNKVAWKLRSKLVRGE